MINNFGEKIDAVSFFYNQKSQIRIEANNKEVLE